jgi:hypothetical protein
MEMWQASCASMKPIAAATRASITLSRFSRKWNPAIIDCPAMCFGRPSSSFH